MPAPDRSRALDHIVVVLFENRSLDNVLGHLYEPGDGKNFDGVIGKDLSNPIPAWAKHGADRKVVPYTVATDLDSPNPDSGEEYFHTNTQLYGILDDHNRFKIGEAAAAPWNAPPPGAVPAMHGFVTDYISTFTGETGRSPGLPECQLLRCHLRHSCLPSTWRLFRHGCEQPLRPELAEPLGSRPAAWCVKTAPHDSQLGL
jgi:phospholipase C